MYEYSQGRIVVSRMRTCRPPCKRAAIVFAGARNEQRRGNQGIKDNQRNMRTAGNEPAVFYKSRFTLKNWYFKPIVRV